ncbi:eukaryotic translation initiation factor 5B isoform X2 [Malaya genurostris]|uniref:eukaryotic translation initiation factor 5B isoform X2 n=1 Tax=Malaya genurostris TaxID=325434 RepID=UPI0026F3F73C|nr:eukaryotic translation initiation factor 5B isoform X2 [Malaya genurostris]
MGKAKKGKKDVAAAGAGEDGSDVEVKQTELTETEVENRKNEKKKKDKKPKKVDSDPDDVAVGVEEVTEEIKKLAVDGKQKGDKKKGKKSEKKEVQQEDDANDEDDDEGGMMVKGKKKGKTTGSAGPVRFSLLMADDDDDEIGESAQNDDEDNDAPQKGKTKSGKKQQVKDEDDEAPQKSGKKSKKDKKKKGGNSDDEDIEKMLAELEMEYSGVKPPPTEETQDAAELNEPTEKKKNKKDKKKKEETPEAEPEESAEGEIRLKTAAEKRKEKKERQKKEAQAAKQQGADIPSEEPIAKEATPVREKEESSAPAGEGKKKKKKGKKDEPEKPAESAAIEEKSIEQVPGKPTESVKSTEAAGKDADKKKKGPNKAALALMQERLKAIREEEERLKREEEEKIRLAEEAEKYHQEQLRLEQEKKERKKLKEKERKERLKAEGKLLTAKQKQDRMRAQAMLDALKAQGVEIPEAGVEKKVRYGTRIRPKKKDDASKEEESKEQSPTVEEQQAMDSEKAEEKVKVDEVKDSWDASDSEEEQDEPEKEEVAPKKKSESSTKPKHEDSDEDDEDDESDDDDSEDASESDSDSEEDTRPESEKMRQRALERIAKRTQDAEKKRTIENLRAAVVCVLGHVDTGKTKILDKLRRTNVQDAEAGGITQQIGATNVPIENIKEQTKFVKGYTETVFKLPGLLIIDTPGHESFSNLRSRGSSLCDIAILVVDIMHGLEPQTIESINLLKSKRTPFVVALNKIDRLYDWSTMNRKDVRDIIKGQAANTQLEFTQRTKEVIVQFAEQGLNAALYYENPDPKSYISLIPTSAITGEGMGNLLFLIVQYCQKQLAKRLMFSEDLQATVLEVKAIAGLGTTIDAILINGKLREGDTMILAGTEGPIVTQIKALLMPQPMKELRVKNAYVEHKEVLAAQGVKIAAKELEKAIAGLNLQIAQRADEVEIFKDIVARDLKSVLSSIKLSDRGVYVQASTLGSLEALLEFLRTSKIPYSGIRIGPVVKRDVMKASTMLEHENQYATILAFDVKVERDAQELADSLGVKIFQADIIYHLFDKFMAYREEIKQRKREEFKTIAVFPCKLKILPQFVFNSRDPIVIGVIIEAGVVKEGTPICVPNKEISRQSIDACKDYFRDDLLKSDWALMVELKKTFQIL